MKRIINIMMSIAASAVVLSSCTNFLTVEPKTFMSPDSYFNTDSELEDAANGLYSAVGSVLFTGLVAPNYGGWMQLEFLTGYHDRTYPTDKQLLGIKLPLLDDNALCEYNWDYRYTSINNCNNVIKGIENSSADLTESVKNSCLAQAYILRAYYYFELVREFGPVPMSLEPTSDISNLPLVPASEEEVYTQVISDLQTAETLLAGTDYNPGDGHVGLGAAKSILAKVYLTMAGYPLQKGTEYYKLAYDKAKEVITSGAYKHVSYREMVSSEDHDNKGEYGWIMAVQFDKSYSNSGVPLCLLPYGKDQDAEAAAGISAQGDFGGAVVPSAQFISSYDAADKRAAEKNYFYSSYGGYDFTRPFIYKFFDADALSDGKSAQDYPIIRFADILLVEAEAACSRDGGSTTDASAIDAYYQVRSVACPSETKPESITFDQVFKERVWELCFEAQNWYDMVRTHKTFDIAHNKVVDMIGFTPTLHDQAFTADDLYFPYPLAETRLNENLVR